MKIALALDLQRRSDGAIVFARWLSKQLEAGTVDIHALHAVENTHFRHLQALYTNAEIRELELERIKQLEERTATHELDKTIDIVRGSETGAIINDYCRSNAADMLIIGRAARVGESKLVRLGSVARKLVRRLPAPTAVVPPDLEAADIGDGPVLVALDGQAPGLAAAQFARDFATRLGRKLAFVHVTIPPETWCYGYVDSGATKSVREFILDEGRKTITQWMRDHEFGDLENEVEVCQGPMPSTIHRHARDIDACCIVAGSRALNAIERIFSSSVGSEIAATSAIPVFIVPPTATGLES